jgi:biopolymer transport protein ExbB
MATRMHCRTTIGILCLALAAWLVSADAGAQTSPADTQNATGGGASATAPETQAAPSSETPSDVSPATPAAPLIAVPTAPAQEMVENPYGLSALWHGGDFIARGTLIALLVMSMGSWYVIITKLVEQFVLAHQARQAERIFWRAASVREGAEKLGRRSAFRMIIDEGLRASEHREGTLTEQIDLNAWITMSLQRAAEGVGNRMQRGLALLATVGSTAPFVGLFGTVWGIYHALTAIGIAGQASIDKVAGPVGEALIMTAMGLAVAVPAVLGYNWLIRRNKLALDRVRNFAADLLAVLTGAVRTGQRQVARSA